MPKYAENALLGHTDKMSSRAESVINGKNHSRFYVFKTIIIRTLEMYG